MRLLPARTPRAPFPVADRDRDGNPYRIMHPRLAAIDLLREKCADGKAGVDVYDESVFIVDAHAHETVWVHRCLSLCGILLGQREHNGGIRYRAVLESDVRVELNLDETRNRPVIDDEPLSSRGISAHMEAILDIVHPTQPRLTVLTEVEPEQEEPVPVHRAAMERARHLAALRVACRICNTLPHVECGCEDVDRLASAVAAKGQVH